MCIETKEQVHCAVAGSSDVYFNDLYSLNFQSMKWSQLNTSGTLPAPRVSMGFASALSSLYVFSGIHNGVSWPCP